MYSYQSNVNNIQFMRDRKEIQLYSYRQSKYIFFLFFTFLSNSIKHFYIGSVKILKLWETTWVTRDHMIYWKAILGYLYSVVMLEQVELWNFKCMWLISGFINGRNVSRQYLFYWYFIQTTHQCIDLWPSSICTANELY